MAVLHSRESLLALLQENGIATKIYDHPKVLTVEEQAKYVGHLEGGHSKNLLLKDKKNRLILVSALTTTKIDMKVLSQRLGLGKSGLRMAPEDIMQGTLKVPLGCVTPFALLNESARSVTLLLDEGFKIKSQLFFHPLSNSATTALAPSGLDNFLQLIGREPVYVNLEAVVDVGKDQPPDLASYLLDLKVDGSMKQDGDTESPVKAGLLSVSNGISETGPQLVKPKAKLSSTKAVKEPSRTSVADVQGTTTIILDDFISAVEEVMAQVVEKHGNDAAMINSGELRHRLAPELESLLMALKNTAYTEGFVAGIASRTLAR